MTCGSRPSHSWSRRPPGLGPGELRVLGARVLERLASDLADQAEYRRLLAAEQRADAATRLWLRRRGDGCTDLHARIPEHTADRLTTYLNAFTAPRRRHLHPPGGGGDTVATPFGPPTAAEAD